jgi:hypothetical protein
MQLSEIEKSLLLGIAPKKVRIGRYSVERKGHVLTFYTSNDQPWGRITLSPSEESRGALWIHDALAGQFYLEGKRWHVYPINNGLLASSSVQVNPFAYLIDRFEGIRSKKIEKSARKSAAC